MRIIFSLLNQFCLMINNLTVEVIELGIYTFVENTPDTETGETLHPAKRMSNLRKDRAC